MSKIDKLKQQRELLESWMRKAKEKTGDSRKEEKSKIPVQIQGICLNL